MTDEYVRALERQWAASGVLEDEVRYLQARRRAGEVDREQLELAALLGHPAAGIVSGSSFDLGRLRSRVEAALWAYRVFEEGGHSLVVRVLLGLARKHEEHLRGPLSLDPSLADRIEGTLRAVEAWLLLPDDRNRKRVGRCGGKLRRRWSAPPSASGAWLRELAWRAATVAASRSRSEIRDVLASEVWAAANCSGVASSVSLDEAVEGIRRAAASGVLAQRGG